MKMYRPHRLCPRNSKPKEPSLYRSLCVSILCMFLSTVMLVGTTFAWFYSSATSAVSTITAGGLNVTTSYITQSTARKYAASETGIPSNEWIPFDGNGGNPFGSIPFSSNSPQVIFLRLENPGSSDIRYRFALNLLSEAPGKTADGQEVPVSKKLVYGCEVLDTADLLELAYFDPTDRTNPDTKTANFVTDSLSEHSGTRSEDGNIISFGGYVGEVFLAANSGAKYVAIALYMPENVDLPNFVALPTIAVQLAMTVEQANTTEPQQPNVVISPISNSTVVEIKQAVIEQPKEEVVAAPVDDDAKPSESTGDNATADQQPTTDTNATETLTPAPPANPPTETAPSAGSTETDTPSNVITTPSNGENLS